MKVYVAGAATHGLSREFQGLVGFLRDVLGHEITHEWWLSEEKTAEQALRDLQGVQEADAVIAVFTHDDYPYRGTWVEVGYALALGKPVYIVGTAGDQCIFVHHPNVRRGVPL